MPSHQGVRCALHPLFLVSLIYAVGTKSLRDPNGDENDPRFLGPNENDYPRFLQSQQQQMPEAEEALPPPKSLLAVQKDIDRLHEEKMEGKNLDAVQSDIDKVEKEVMREVVQLQTIRQYFNGQGGQEGELVEHREGRQDQEHQERGRSLGVQDRENEYAVQLQASKSAGGDAHFPIPLEMEHGRHDDGNGWRYEIHPRWTGDGDADRGQDTLLRELEHQARQVGDLQDRIKELQSTLKEGRESLERKNASLEDENKALKAQLEETTKKMREIEKSTEEDEDQIRRTAEVQAQNAKHAIEDRTQKAQELTSELATFKTQAQVAETKVKSLENQLERKSKEADKIKEMLEIEKATIAKDNEAMKKELETENNKLIQKNQELTGQLLEEKMKITSLAQKALACERQIASLSQEAKADLAESQETIKRGSEELGTLSHEIVKQHDYGKLCHNRVTQLELQLNATVNDAKEKIDLAENDVKLHRLNTDLRNNLTRTIKLSEGLNAQIAQVQHSLKVEKEHEAANSQAAKIALAAKDAEITKLNAEILKQHEYGTLCHGQATQLQARLQAEAAKLKQEDHAAQVAAEFARASAAAAQQRLSLESQLQKKRADKQEEIAKTAVTQYHQVLSQMKLIKKDADAEVEKDGKEVQHLKFAEGAYKQQLKACDHALTLNVNARNVAVQHLDDCQKKSIDHASEPIQLKLDQCEDIKTKVTQSLEDRQVRLAKCTAEKDAAVNKWKAESQELATKDDQLRTTQQQAQAEIVAKTKETAEYEEEAQKAVMQAEAQLSSKCGLLWKKKNETTAEKLKKCKLADENLIAAEAQVVTLEQSLQACMQTEKE